MKKNKTFIILFTAGVIFMISGIILQTDYYSTLLFSLGFSLVFISTAKQIRRFYYQMPWNQEKALARKQESHLEAVDERKIYLRERAGALTNQLLTLILLVVTFILALFHTAFWIICLVFGLFLIQQGLYFFIHHSLEKNY